MRGRRSSKIASLLSIAVRNVENRIAGIKLKLGCGSQEGIIDFIEKSGKLVFMNQYYTSLLIEIVFERTLRTLSELITQNPVCYIVYDGGEKDKIFMPRQLKKHLTLAGLNLLEVKENYHMLAQPHKKTEPSASHIICCLSASLIGNNPELFSFFKNNHSVESIILISLNTAVDMNAPTTLPNSIQSFDLTKQQNYYLLVFEVLKIVFPNLSFEENILNFKKQCITLSDGSFNHFKEEKVLLQNSNTWTIFAAPILRRIKFISFMSMVLLLCCMGWLCKNISTKFWQMNPQESIASIKDTKTWNIPRQDHSFVGREQLLETLETKLHPSLTPAIYGKSKKETAIQTVYPVSVCAGMGGVGKTQLALHYAHHPKHAYTLIAWFFAENIDELKQQYIEFARSLGYREEKSSIETALPYVKEWLSRHPGWLLIYDNVNNYTEIKNYLPQGKGSMIITTRQQHWPSAFQTLEIGVMTEEESIQLIQSLIHRKITDTEEKAAKELVNILDYLPLALAQASSYIHQTKITIIDYLNLYKNHERELLADSAVPEGTNSLPVAATWNISLEAIAKEAKEKHEPLLALELLNVCAYLAPEKISHHLLITWLKEAYPTLSSPELVLPKLIAQLWRYSLINGGEDGSIAVHRLVQAAVRNQHNQPLDKKTFASDCSCLTLEWYRLLLKSIHDEFKLKTNILEDEARQKKLLPHLQMLLSHYKQRWPTHSESSLISILNDIGTVFSLMGDRKLAKSYYEDALRAIEQEHGKNHVELVYTLDKLGQTYGHLGDATQAKIAYERALKIQEQCCGTNNIEAVHILNRLGVCYRYLGDAKQAKELHERALKIQEQYFDINNAEAADILNQLGRDYKNLGDTKKAKELHERALVIKEQHFGKDHIEIAYVLNQLGRSLENPKQAKELHERALKIQEQYFGEGHFESTFTLDHLGNNYRDLGDTKKARKLHEQALILKEKYFGKDHFELAFTLDSLGKDYKNLGGLKKAKELHERSLKIKELYYGIAHQELIETLTALGNTHQSLKNLKQAQLCFERALKIRKQHLEPN